MSSREDTGVSGFLQRHPAAALLALVTSGCTGTRPADLGIHAGHLRPCPGTPNCVSSEPGTPPDKLVKAFPAPGGRADMTRLADLVRGSTRAAVITVTPEYLHAEFTSLLLRFVDDVEFRFDSTSGEIHVRSASRLGKGDLGVNRKRVNGLLERWSAATGGTR